MLATALSGCAGSVGPSTTVAHYLAAWTQRDYPAMAALVHKPPANFVSFNRQVATDLDLERAVYTSGPVTTTGSTATVAVTSHLVIGPLGPLKLRSTLHLSDTTGSWKVVWSPRSIISALAPGETVATTVSWPTRADILGYGGQPLTAEAPMVTVGIEGARITGVPVVTAALEQAGATAAQVASALATATAHPQWFVSVVDVTKARYAQLEPVIYPVPGTVFKTYFARDAVTPGLAAHIVGSVGPVTSQELGKLGSPYQVGDTTGQTGIEQAYEKQLAGRPGGSVAIVRGGVTLATVGRFASHPGTPVRTTIDPTVQQAAEAALAGITQPAAIVAIDPSTGDVKASVSVPASDGFDNALAGSFPPGSTFKVVTSADLIEHGSTPSSPAHCPPTITVGGQVFHNFEGETTASLSLEQAFAESCNAAFIGLAGSLPFASFTTTAAQFGIGDTYHLGLTATGGTVPTPATAAARAATSIGQAQVLVSPLAMATAAAAVASGSLRLPRLVVGAGTSGATALNPTVVTDLRTMMAAVVDSPDGTAAGAGLPAGTLGKTGTAEFGTANPPATHAWFMGYQGNLAFAVLVVGGGIGGKVAAPIAAKFLRAVGAP
jgi:cell division protein FtsI/penicillin-binding protein 2